MPLPITCQTVLNALLQVSDGNRARWRFNACQVLQNLVCFLQLLDIWPIPERLTLTAPYKEEIPSHPVACTGFLKPFLLMEEASADVHVLLCKWLHHVFNIGK